ncbi:MAG: hypothetical protein ACRD22_08670, partial [Terriglobia bacterium]
MPHQIRVELLELKNIWGIQYPPPDWRRAPAVAVPARASDPSPPAAPTGSLKPPHGEPVSVPASPAEETALPSRWKTSQRNAGTTLAGLEVDLSAAAKPASSAPLQHGSDSEPAFRHSRAGGNPEPLPAPPQAGQTGQRDAGAMRGTDSEQLFKAAGLKLAQLAGQIDARLQANGEQLLMRLGEKEQIISSLTVQLTGMAERAESSYSSMEALLAQTEEARRIAQHEFQEAGVSLQRASEQLFSSATQDLGAQLAERLESTAGSLIDEMRRRAAEDAAAAAREFKEDMRKSLAGLAESQISAGMAEFQALHSRTLKETESRISETLAPAVEHFVKEIEQSVESIRQNALPTLTSELASKAALEFEAKQSEARERVQAEISLITSAALESLQAQIEEAKAKLQQTSLVGLSEQLTAQSASELQAQQAGVVEQAKGEIQASAHSVIESLQAEFEQSRRTLEESMLPALAGKITAQAAAELQAQQAGVVEQAKGEIQASTRSVIEGLQAEFEQSRRTLEESG